MASGKRMSLASLATAPVESVPGHSAATHTLLKPETIAPTPRNRRQNFGTPGELEQLGESMRVRQLQPVVVVSRTDYLRIFPEHADDENIKDADYVLVNGERRWRAAVQVELPILEALERPQLADSRADFLDALFTENFDRMNLDPIEEAHAVEDMVAECGTAVTAAKKLRRHETWVSQRRALLKLAPHLQDLVRSGDLPVRIARSIAKLPEAEQEAAWHKTRAAEEARRAGTGADDGPPDTGAGQSGPVNDEGHGGTDIDAGDPDPEPGAGPRSKRTSDPQPEDDGDDDPDLYRGKDQGSSGPDVMPWYSPADLARVIREKLQPEAVSELVAILTGG